ncbi:hypothetical protein FBQ82_00025 [Anaerolineae bacterium CFX7]|nr:hypothetical protein [Anaerolineae bacterium CFX7]
MPTTSSDQIQFLIVPVIERLEKSPVEFVEALIDLFAAPERKREPHLLQDLLLQVWLLLEFPKLFPLSTSPINTSKKSSRSARLTRYEQLIELMCNVIEKAIIRHLPFDQEGISLNSKAIQHFWGGLALHIKLALPLEPRRGTALYSNGVVLLPNAKSFPCEPPLSESQIYSLLTQLGHSFVFEYANTYVTNEQLCSVINQFAQSTKKHTPSKNDSVSLELFVQERTLNRYVDKFAKRLAAHFRDACKRFTENPPSHFHTLLGSSSPDSIFSQWIADASDALVINPKTIESHNLQPIAKQSSTGVWENNLSDRASRITVSRGFDYKETLERFTQFQEKTIRDSIHTTFVPQDLIYHDVGRTESRKTEIGEMVNSTNQRLIITAPPGGGKTRLLQEILLLRPAAPAYHLYINVAEFTVPRFRTFYHFAAYEILTRNDSDRRDIFNLENDLLMLDMNGNIVWYLDDWDSNSQRDSSSVSSLAGLGKFILATSSPFLAMEQLSSNRAAHPRYVKIQPFTQTQIAEFIKTNSTNQNPSRTQIERRALQLPGLAQLPGGLQYICAHREQETVVDTLLGFINSHFEKNEEPVFDLKNLDHQNLPETKSDSSTLGSGFLIVKALSNRTRGTTIDFSNIGIDAIVPYMGASNQAENRRLAIERIGRAVQGKLLQVNADGQTFRFVVPEIAHLLVAVTALAEHHGKRWLHRTLEEFQKHPHSPMLEIMLAIGMWYQERPLLEYA